MGAKNMRGITKHTQKTQGQALAHSLACLWQLGTDPINDNGTLICTTLEISLASTLTKDISASIKARQLFKKRKKITTKKLQNECNLVPVTLIVQK